MTPKQRGVTPSAATPAPAVVPQPKSKASAQGQNWNQVLQTIYDQYVSTTPQRTKLIDAFMAFLVAAGGIQFLYCIIAGNYVSRVSG